MRRIYPLPAEEVGLFEVYGRLEGGASRPAVRANMIASADGAATLDGRTGGLAGPEDRALLVALRSLADVVLVGATTARTEHYGPARLDEELRAHREAAGLTVVPAIAVVTRSCNLDWTAKLFTEAEERTIVITTEEAAAALGGEAGEVAEVLTAGRADVSMAAALDALAERGHASVLAEGGPSVLAQLAAADLVDELCLTVAPTMVPSPVGRIVAPPMSAAPAEAVPLELVHALVGDDDVGGYLFLRYARRSPVIAVA